MKERNINILDAHSCSVPNDRLVPPTLKDDLSVSENHIVQSAIPQLDML